MFIGCHREHAPCCIHPCSHCTPPHRIQPTLAWQKKVKEQRMDCGIAKAPPTAVFQGLAVTLYSRLAVTLYIRLVGTLNCSSHHQILSGMPILWELCFAGTSSLGPRGSAAASGCAARRMTSAVSATGVPCAVGSSCLSVAHPASAKLSTHVSTLA